MGLDRLEGPVGSVWIQDAPRNRIPNQIGNLKSGNVIAPRYELQGFQ